jgi:hypothetical protein
MVDSHDAILSCDTSREYIAENRQVGVERYIARHVAQDRHAAEPGTFPLCDKIGQRTAVFEVTSANHVCMKADELRKWAEGLH